jgi:hypothetical protein
MRNHASHHRVVAAKPDDHRAALVHSREPGFEASSNFEGCPQGNLQRSDHDAAPDSAPTGIDYRKIRPRRNRAGSSRLCEVRWAAFTGASVPQSVVA